MKLQKNILIVEDEVLIANQIEMFLEFNGYNSVGIAVDYTGAIELLENNPVDLILLDVKINGSKTGMDVAKYINENLNLPFLFLTSYNDKETLQKLKLLHPIGYINKPINDATLLTTIDIYFSSTKIDSKTITPIVAGTKTYNINFADVLYVETEHVYLNLYLTNTKKVIRLSLINFLEQINSKQLIQINRSTAINPSFINSIDKNKVNIKDKTFKISDKYKSNLNC
ncbi:MAG: response regulator [Polaribacter sp.]